MNSNNILVNPVFYKLETWNGVSWDIGHIQHKIITFKDWEELRPFVKRWSCKWRLLKITTTVKEQSK